MIYDRSGFHFLFYLHGMAGLKARAPFILKVINYMLSKEVLRWTVSVLKWTSLPVSVVSLSAAFSGNKALCQADTQTGDGGVTKKDFCFFDIRLIQ